MKRAFTTWQLLLLIAVLFFIAAILFPFSGAPEKISTDLLVRPT